jgi:hypothetical protein
MARVLEFDVNEQQLSKKKDCDFRHLIAGSKGYLMAQFHLGYGWEGCVVAASFWNDGVEYPVVLDEYGLCDIPEEALTGRKFYVSLTGMIKGTVSDYLITTNKIKITQGVQ